MEPFDDDFCNQKLGRKSIHRDCGNNTRKTGLEKLKFNGDAVDHRSSGGPQRYSQASLGYFGPHVTQRVCLTLMFVPMSMPPPISCEQCLLFIILNLGGRQQVRTSRGSHRLTVAGGHKREERILGVRGISACKAGMCCASE